MSTKCAASALTRYVDLVNAAVAERILLA